MKLTKIGKLLAKVVLFGCFLYVGLMEMCQPVPIKKRSPKRDVNSEPAHALPGLDTARSWVWLFCDQMQRGHGVNVTEEDLLHGLSELETLDFGNTLRRLYGSGKFNSFVQAQADLVVDSVVDTDPPQMLPGMLRVRAELRLARALIMVFCERMQAEKGMNVRYEDIVESLTPQEQIDFGEELRLMDNDGSLDDFMKQVAAEKGLVPKKKQ